MCVKWSYWIKGIKFPFETTVCAVICPTVLFFRSMSGNNLRTLSEGLLDNMTLLENLYLSDNSMTHLRSLNAKAHLESVDISNNDLQTIAYKAFTGLTSLTSL